MADGAVPRPIPVRSKPKKPWSTDQTRRYSLPLSYLLTCTTPEVGSSPLSPSCCRPF
ncbi:uncharacterized protein TRAVEDRAFT_60176 [Trametes versicolor FP-101664 SS1]|uniref:uncharacterized protein n=1 Tax=Trametes versicolor (strain FP-101664) TaxID=717944 RepID=UPI0004623623|nr:uncharacterized protein TRAVEDRAFT_60176 [Trametes versicolor FP-101664 SS1]EIW56240.1 hypothetical protein TRAVEDRAFT_60176 [Trametes versicolor FP-101664 SS1]